MNDPTDPTDAAGPTGPGDAEPPDAATARHRAAAELVDRYWQNVWIERDLDVIGELYTDPTVRHTAGGSRSLSISELQDTLTDALRVLRGENFTVDQLTVVDDIAWLRLTLHGMSMATMTPTTIVWLAQYRLAGNKIAETWALHQSGLDWLWE